MTWTKSQIQQARKIPLAPILRQKGITLHELAGDNYRIDLSSIASATEGSYDDLFIKDSYWIWKSRNIHGNTIDFFILVEKMSFSQAMNLIYPK